MKKLFCTFAALGCATIYAHSSLALSPVDDATKDPSLLAFRKQLIAAVKRKDDRFVKSILAPDVKYALGGGSGQFEFMQNYQFLRKDSAFWSKFSTAITHGGSLQTDSDGKTKLFNAPFSFFGNAKESANEQGVICDPNVAVLARPDASAGKIASSTYDIVQVPSAKPIVEDWMKVIMTDGRTGYVHRSQLILRSDPFATFKQDKGQWKLTWFGSASP